MTHIETNQITFGKQTKNTMKAAQVNLKKEGFTFSCNYFAARSHYKSYMRSGQVFPSTKPQAQFFISEGVCLDVLNQDDVEIVESMLSKHGFQGNYEFTKSKTWVRLQNQSDLHKALKIEYSL